MSLRPLLVASARSVVVKSAGLLSVSSLNPAGNSFVFVRLFAADNTFLDGRSPAETRIKVKDLWNPSVSRLFLFNEQSGEGEET